jgi:hypothetical protein
MKTYLFDPISSSLNERAGNMDYESNCGEDPRDIPG